MLTTAFALVGVIAATAAILTVLAAAGFGFWIIYHMLRSPW